MNHGSLFSGIGGFDLAAQWMGWNNVFHCEINPFGQKVLKYYWPNAISYDDITKTDFTIWRGRVDVLTGGFPCQPFSVAGKRKGTEDSRNLWPEYHRAIREIQPTWVVGENVPGLINWSDGLVFEQVQADLEAEGYEVWPFILPACSLGAPHRRDRIWFIAYSERKRLEKPEKIKQFIELQDVKRNDSQDAADTASLKNFRNGQGRFFSKSARLNEQGSTPNTGLQRQEERQQQTMGVEQLCEKQLTPNTASQSSQRVRSEQREYSEQEQGEFGGDSCSMGSWYASNTNSGRQSSEEYRQKESGRIAEKSIPTDWSNFPTQSPVCHGNDGFFTQSHRIAISENRNDMDRNIVTKLCLEEGRLKVDFITGKIYSLKRRGKEGQEIELIGADCNGYIVHGIRYNGFKIQLRAHQIVWIAANGLYDKSVFMIDHINRNKKDNRLENLRLVDAKGNRENSTEYKGKLTGEQKDMIVWLHKEDGIPMRELAEDYGISKSRVQQIISEHSGIYGITFPKWRNESIKAAGNAIVPQVVFQIFKAIEQFNLNLNQ